MTHPQHDHLVAANRVENAMSPLASNSIVKLTDLVREQIAFGSERTTFRIMFELEHLNQAKIPTLGLCGRAILSPPIMRVVDFLLSTSGDQKLVHHESCRMFLRRRNSRSNSRSGMTRPASMSSMPS